jgi:class 3 adenylate cyclase
MPETRYAKAPDGVRIAYQAFGEGQTDIVLLPNMSCVDLMWEDPSFSHTLNRLASMGRVICSDGRGVGSSDAVPLGALPTAEAWMEDVTVVMDAVGSEQDTVIANFGAGIIAMLFAASHPERTTRLVLINCVATFLRDDDYPFGALPEMTDAYATAVEGTWGTTVVDAPSREADPHFRRWYGRYQRLAASPATAGAIYRWSSRFDVRSILPAIRVPTLVLHREEWLLFSVDHARYITEHVPNARLRVVPGTDTLFYTEAADVLLDEIEEFITGTPPVREPDRALATVLFTDIVSSTSHATRLGDRRWRQLLDQHDAVVSRELERHRGRKVNPTGDGILATFDGPARAVRCAQAIIEAVGLLGIEIRAGLHTGEVELRGEDIGGIAVHIGQRVSALAGPREVLVSSTVRDLVAGSGIVFADRGMNALKGVPEEWRLFAVQS